MFGAFDRRLTGKISGQDIAPEIRPFTRDDVAAVLDVARRQFPDW
jgi:hypothetical protein